MFSFNGGGGKSMLSKRWNDIDSTLKGNKMNQEKTGKKDVAKRLPMSSMKKLTATQ